MEQVETNKKFQIETRTGEMITLDKKTVIDYLANGTQITNSEYTMFFQLCKVHKVNPFLKEAYIVKYGSSPATIILDYKVLQQVADENPNYKGMKTGIVVFNKDTKESVERYATYVLPNETLIAGFCEVYRKDRDIPTKVYSMFDEFVAKDKEGKPNKNWAGKPTFMIVKVAKAQALREAFPNMFGSNVYTNDEFDTSNKKEETKETKFESTQQVKDDVIDNVASEPVDLTNINDNGEVVEEKPQEATNQQKTETINLLDD